MLDSNIGGRDNVLVMESSKGGKSGFQVNVLRIGCVDPCQLAWQVNQIDG
jgi:hypothetical protein